MRLLFLLRRRPTAVAMTFIGVAIFFILFQRTERAITQVTKVERRVITIEQRPNTCDGLSRNRCIEVLAQTLTPAQLLRLHDRMLFHHRQRARAERLRREARRRAARRAARKTRQRRARVRAVASMPPRNQIFRAPTRQTIKRKTTPRFRPRPRNPTPITPTPPALTPAPASAAGPPGQTKDGPGPPGFVCAKNPHIKKC